MRKIRKSILIALPLALIFAMCTACANQHPNESTPNEVELSSPESTQEIGLSFALPEDYEETAKQLASDFTIQWARAYRKNDGEILQTLVDNYGSMIAEVRQDIVTTWNNDRLPGANTWRTYVAGPTVSSATIQNNHIENDAVHLTVEVSMTATVQQYTTVTWSYTGYPISVIDSGTYEMYYDLNGWHFKTAKLRLNG